MAAWHRRLRARARARARGFREPLTAHGSGRGPLLLGGYVAALGCMTQRPPDIPAPGMLERFQVTGARAQASGRCPRRSTMPDSPPGRRPALVGFRGRNGFAEDPVPRAAPGGSPPAGGITFFIGAFGALHPTGERLSAFPRGRASQREPAEHPEAGPHPHRRLECPRTVRLVWLLSA